MPTSESWALAPFLQTVAAAGVGAFIANFASEFVKGLSRQSQAVEVARDEDLARILRIVSELEDLATHYWTIEGEDLLMQENLLRSRIVARQQHLLELIAHLFSNDAKRECDVVVTRLLDAIGGGQFGDPERQAEPERLQAVYLNKLTFEHLAQKKRRELPRGWLA